VIAGLRKAANALERSSTNSESNKTAQANVVLDEYVVGMPSAQHAIDALPGWNAALPPHLNVKAGVATFYADNRILWAIEQFGSIEGRRILELGPLEASHTWLLEQQGPSVIHSIEANKLSYLRCLVVKEILGMTTAKFFLGDFAEWLDKSGERYDLVIASGVLYHMSDPIALIRSIAERTDAFYLWTHYVSDDAMPPGDPRRGALIGQAEVHQSEGVGVRLFKRSYYGAWKSKSFCGGPHDLHRWIERNDLLALIRAFGFDDIRIAHDEPLHPNGPSFSIFAHRTSARPQGGVAADAASDTV
jgi:hypothetical protein